MSLECQLAASGSLINQRHQLALDVAADGYTVVGDTVNNGSWSQQWHFQRVGLYAFTISNKKTGQYLSLAKDPTDGGAVVVSHEPHNWDVVPMGPDRYKLFSNVLYMAEIRSSQPGTPVVLKYKMNNLTELEKDMPQQIWILKF